MASNLIAIASPCKIHNVQLKAVMCPKQFAHLFETPGRSFIRVAEVTTCRHAFYTIVHALGGLELPVNRARQLPLKEDRNVVCVFVGFVMSYPSSGATFQK